MKESRYQQAAAELIADRVEKLRELTYGEAETLPESEGGEISIGGTLANFTIYRQNEPSDLAGCILVTVQVARPGMLGLASFHIERGLVFSPHESTREATEIELQNSGG